MAVAEPGSRVIERLGLGGERAVAERSLAHQRPQRLGERSVRLRGAVHVAGERSCAPRRVCRRGSSRRLR